MGIMIGYETQSKPAPRGNVIVNNFFLGNRLNLVTDSNLSELKDTTIAYNTFASTVKTQGYINSGYNMNVYFRSNLNSFTNSVFENNIVYEAKDGGQLIPIRIPSWHTGFTLSHNNWYKEPISPASGTGDVIGNPKLTKIGPTGPGSLTADYFTILKDSPVRNTAKVLAEVTKDFFQTPRGQNPDMGGYEYAEGDAENLPPTPPTGLRLIEEN
jgi:hypothetical protein